MDNVSFILDNAISSSSMWIRDYGPFYIHEDGARAIVDYVYGTYSGDDNVPFTIADYFSLPIYDSSIIHHGGNHITDGNRMGFSSTNIFNYNPGFTEEEIRNNFKDYLGIDSLIVIEPMNGDGTGHIDMFCKLLSDTLFIVGEYENPEVSYPGDYELLNNLAEYLGSLYNLDGRQFKVERIPMPPFYYGGPAGTINYTYTNSLIINDKVLVPIYGFETDEEALQIYSDLMPENEIIGLNSGFIIQYWGATHCVTSEHFSENPLIVLHEEIDSLQYNSSSQIKFRLNPKFEESQGSVFYKSESEEYFTEVMAELNNGIWTANLPAMTEDFCYYITGNATSGVYEFEVTLPEFAPSVTFPVQVGNVYASADVISPEVSISNYPNPFNPTTMISFSIPEASNVEFSIFNIKGQKVKTLVSPNLEKGTHSIIWNGTDENNQSVASGIYFYKLKNGNCQRVKKMLLLK